MTKKQIAFLTSGFLGLVAFGYFSTQIIGATATSLLGFGLIGTGAALEAVEVKKQRNHKTRKHNVTNL
ncbi:hypothetical protein IQ243_28645 [Nostocales cyanobacterium LEGE 11386]|nr:hypothetical protein [Nostocales cyanobacterium LEGE 11386]